MNSKDPDKSVGMARSGFESVNSGDPTKIKKESYIPPMQWLLLLAPPLITPFVAAAFYLLAFAGLGGIGVILYLLTPLICAIWAFRTF
jgi:hypothetical protein